MFEFSPVIFGLFFLFIEFDVICPHNTVYCGTAPPMRRGYHCFAAANALSTVTA